MQHFVAKANDLVTVKVRVDKRPYLAAFQDPPTGSAWQNIVYDQDGMGESRQFKMPATSGKQVEFNVEYDEKIGSDDPDPKATYTTVFTGSTGVIGGDKVVVPKDGGPISREYTFTAK